MSDSVLITLMIVLAVIVVLVLFREKLSHFFIKASKDGLETSFDTHKPAKPTSASPQKKPEQGTTPPPAAASMKVGNIQNSQVYNSGAGSDASLEAKDVSGSTVINTRGDINVNKPA